ncbi:MAG: phage terminase small subunit P27 family [Saccharofermentanales bacterium]
MTGRKKLPIQLHEARGNPSRLTKKEIERRKNNQVNVPTGTGEPPTYLTMKQKRIFKEYAEQLIALDIYSDLDKETLAVFVVTSEEYKEYTREIRKIKLNTDEDIFRRKYLAIERDRSFKQMKSAANDLGLTITSRCKLVIPQADKPEENKFKKYVK